MDDSRFFKRLWRVNAAVLLVVLLGVAGEKHLTLFHVKDGAGYASRIALADFAVVGTASLALAE